MEKPAFTLGIEEEYLIVDRDTRDLVAEPDPSFFDACNEALGDRVSAEFLQCQIEVGTRPHRNVGNAVNELRELRRAVASTAQLFGYAVIAASTHPFARWRRQHHTKKDRYDGLAADIGQPVRRMLICGMHMHVGIEDDDLRIDLMNQVSYFLPHMLALSGSSPFWEGEDTRLASYRLTVFDAMPRTGLPDQLVSFAEYRRLVDHLVESECIEDGTKIWWDVRPSDRFPTLEQRVTDVCSRLADVRAIAAFYQTALAYLYRIRVGNQRWRIYPNTLIMENRWRAQRYGMEGKLIDHGAQKAVGMDALMAEFIDVTAQDADELGCAEDLLGVQRIVKEGTSAMRQRRVYAEAVENGADHDEALQAVVDALIEEFGQD